MSAADRLREAARVLRERAEAATPGPWRAATTGVRGGDHWYIVAAGQAIASIAAQDGENEEQREGEATYIATMHPGVGLALADWLDAEADERRWGRLRDFDAVGISDRIADLILGGSA